MPRYIHNDTECRHEEDGDAGFEVKVYSQDEVDQIQGEHLNLIAAAPELLAALEELCRDKYLSDPINNDRMINARAAIAKAREMIDYRKETKSRGAIPGKVKR